MIRMLALEAASRTAAVLLLWGMCIDALIPYREKRP